MRYGASMDVRFDETLLDFADVLAGHALNHVELRQGYLDVHGAAPAPETVRDAATDRDLTVTYHAPHRDCNLAALTERLRRGAVSSVRDTIDAASRADAEAVVVHGGTVGAQYPRRVERRARAQAVRSLRSCAEYAAERGVPLCVENQRDKPGVHRFTATPDRLAGLLDDVGVGPEHLRVTLDVGHAKATGEPLDGFLDAVGERVTVCHLHDNDGESDAHDPLPGYEEVAERVGAPYNVLEMKSLADIRTCVDGPT